MLNILVIESSEQDAQLIKETFKDNYFNNNVFLVTNGVEALNRLQEQNQYHHEEHPDLIILDLNLPSEKGFAIIEAVKTYHLLKTVPVVVFSKEDVEEDVLKAYNLHANCFIPKPDNREDFIEAIHRITNFWCDIVQLPPKLAYSRM